MSRRKFKIGDLVWLRVTADSEGAALGLQPKEHPGVIFNLTGCGQCRLTNTYVVELADYMACSPEEHIRLRRDDFQQHEPVGTMEGLKTILPETADA